MSSLVGLVYLTPSNPLKGPDPTVWCLNKFAYGLKRLKSKAQNFDLGRIGKKRIKHLKATDHF